MKIPRSVRELAARDLEIGRLTEALAAATARAEKAEAIVALLALWADGAIVISNACLYELVNRARAWRTARRNLTPAGEGETNETQPPHP